MAIPADSQCSVPKDSDDSTAKTVDPTRMGWRRRRMALIVTLIGLATFVNPLVETDSEILGRTRWSALQVIFALQAGRLPIRHMMSGGLTFLGIDALFGFGAAYLLLSLIAAAIVFSPSARLVSGASVAGAFFANVVYRRARFGFSDFQDAIYGAPPAFTSGHQAHVGTLCLILFGVFGLLVFIAVTEQLD
jgi:hypothetical protein